MFYHLYNVLQTEKHFTLLVAVLLCSLKSWKEFRWPRHAATF